MKLKNIVVVILVLAIIGTFVGYKIYNKPHVNVVEINADILTTANKIISDFSSDENAANVKYLEKIIELKGVVSETKRENEKGIITLKTNNDFGSVLCYLSEISTEKINSIKVGQNITVKGICTGYLMDVILVKCEIINL